MTEIFRLPIPQLLDKCGELHDLGLRAVALFPKVSDERKDDIGSEALNEEALVLRAAQSLKVAFPELVVVADLALDPYTSHGHDGILSSDGNVDNDATVAVLAKMGVLAAKAGIDIVAPSDMMDGRVAAIRAALNLGGFDGAPIMSYAAKFASAYYGPFRDAAESAPQFGDRRSYQMEVAIAEEALREVARDLREGADIVMVKPALAYLDVLYRVKTGFGCPTAAYAVSGEYSMVQAAAKRDWGNERAVTMESLLAMRRAGADIIVSYAAAKAVRWLKEG